MTPKMGVSTKVRTHYERQVLIAEQMFAEIASWAMIHGNRSGRPTKADIARKTGLSYNKVKWIAENGGRHPRNGDGTLKKFSQGLLRRYIPEHLRPGQPDDPSAKAIPRILSKHAMDRARKFGLCPVVDQTAQMMTDGCASDQFPSRCKECGNRVRRPCRICASRKGHTVEVPETIESETTDRNYREMAAQTLRENGYDYATTENVDDCGVELCTVAREMFRKEGYDPEWIIEPCAFKF